MTFFEAAIEILKREGKPLPTRRLAELAVKHNLLSVVGRDPEGMMEARLEEAFEREGSGLELLRVKPGVYGLRSYPPAPSPTVEATAEATADAGDQAEAEGNGAAAEGEGGEQEEGKAPGAQRGRRRGRRGGRGRQKGPRGEATAAPAKAAADAGAAGSADADGDADTHGDANTHGDADTEAAAAGEASATAPAEGGEKRARRRSRRGGRGRRGGDREASPASAQVPAAEEALATEFDAETPTRVHRIGMPLPVGPEPEATAAQAGADDELLEGEEELAEGEGEEHEFDVPSGPLMAPVGAEEGFRGDEERVVRAEIPGQRDRERERGRRRRGRGSRFAPAPPAASAQPPRREERSGPKERARDEGTAREDRPAAPAPAPRPQEGHKGRGVIDAVLEVLRGEGGRPMHVRHLTDTMVKRHLIDGRSGAGEAARQVRAALYSDEREREADGLRARVRNLGGGHYGSADKKLDPELQPFERDLADRAVRLREATRTAVRRRIQRLAPPAFEALGRALCEKLGLTDVELVKRGDGVAYFGGRKRLGIAAVKTLVSMRPGEQEISRRAVGELRAGLGARGFDEGLMLAGGRPSLDAIAELASGKGVVVHDAESIATLCIKHGLGVRRAQLPIDYLDLEFFSDLSDG